MALGYSIEAIERLDKQGINPGDPINDDEFIDDLKQFIRQMREEDKQTLYKFAKFLVEQQPPDPPRP